MSIRPFRVLRTVATLGLVALLCACASTPKPEPRADRDAIDLQRFMGRWHVIAHVPYFAEEGDVASVDEYVLKEPGKIAVTYHYQKGFNEPRKTIESRATVREGTGNRDWTTWFFAVVPTPYRILEVAPDYSWALIGYPGRDLAWVFARKPVIDDALYARLVDKLHAHLVDTTKLRRVPQLPEQVGKPGFADPEKP